MREQNFSQANDYQMTMLEAKEWEVLLFSFQFKENLKDVLQPEHDDHYLLRWLRGKLISELFVSMIKQEESAQYMQTHCSRSVDTFFKSVVE